MGYEQYAKEAVLRPSGIPFGAMFIAKDELADQQPNEVKYVSSKWNPYAHPVRRMDSHGGWIASPIDLVRFAVNVENVLSSTSFKTMATKQTDAYYAKGWVVNSPDALWHNGLILGSTAILVKRYNGFVWAALANTAELDDQGKFTYRPWLDTMMNDVYKLVGARWPANLLYSLDKGASSFLQLNQDGQREDANVSARLLAPAACIAEADKE